MKKNSLIWIVGAVAVAGAGYYFLFMRGKKFVVYDSGVDAKAKADGSTRVGRQTVPVNANLQSGQVSPVFNAIVEYDCSLDNPITKVSVSGPRIKSAANVSSNFNSYQKAFYVTYDMKFDDGSEHTVTMQINYACDKKNFIDKLIVSEEKTAFRTMRH